MPKVTHTSLTVATRRPQPADDAAKDLAHAFARANAAALRGLYRKEIAAEYGVRATESKSALALVTESRSSAFNRVVNLGMFEPATAAQLDEIVALYARTSAPFAVQLNPFARPAALDEWLQQRGLRPGEPWTVLSRRLVGEVDAVAGIAVDRVEPSAASAYARVSEIAFDLSFGQGSLGASAIGQPGWSHYLAHDEGRAFAAAAMFVHGRTALFAGSGALPSQRGRGAQTALIARRLRDAAALGCDVALVETAEPLDGEVPAALRNVTRAGFAVAFRQRSFTS